MPEVPPSVVFVLTDDQGYGDLSCHGNPILKTPHIDALHAVSVRLTDYHVGPTCAPTRAGLLTGHYANSTGVWRTSGGRSLLRSDEVSMADYFRRSGYATGIFGKWHLGDNAPYRPQDRGFETVVVHGGGGVSQTPDYWGNSYFDDRYWDGQQYRRFEGYCTDVWFRESLRFIKHNRHRPFFCYIPTNAPHAPHLVEPSYSDPYLPLTPHEGRAKFYGMVARIDENVGELRRALREMEIERNTIFIFMTDNGSSGGLDVDQEHFVINGYNAGMRGKKASEYDGGHRVPFFLHWPAGGMDKGRDVDRLTANIDILPTLVELCGLVCPDDVDFDGRSLVPLLQDESGGEDGPSLPSDGKSQEWPKRAVVTDTQRMPRPIKWRRSAVMTDNWRLVNGGELYAIREDPEQRNDLSAGHPEVVAELRLAYEEWWQKVSRQFDEEIPIPIGGPGSSCLRVNTYDWRSGQDEEWDGAWNQCLVRQGVICNGYWEVDVRETGSYRFTLRRWPEEEDAEITAGLGEGKPVSWTELRIDSDGEAASAASWKERIRWGGGVALPVHRAGIAIAGKEAWTSVSAGDDSASFVLSLPEGGTHLQTWFQLEDGRQLGAYYVYVEQLGVDASD